MDVATVAESGKVLLAMRKIFDVPFIYTTALLVVVANQLIPATLCHQNGLVVVMKDFVVTLAMLFVELVQTTALDMAFVLVILVCVTLVSLVPIVLKFFQRAPKIVLEMDAANATQMRHQLSPLCDALAFMDFLELRVILQSVTARAQ